MLTDTQNDDDDDTLEDERWERYDRTTKSLAGHRTA